MKILMGGSPCTYWSIAKTNNRETEASGQGWELFKNYLIAKEKYEPRYFLYENNKSMAKPIKEQITKELGVEPIMINSALVSAQSRERYYWTNIPNVAPPEDKGILLRDILDTGYPIKEKAYTLDSNYWKTTGRQGFDTQSGRRQMVAESVTAQVLNVNPSGKGMNGAVIHTNGKCRCLTTNKGEGQKIIEPVRIGTIESAAINKSHDSQQYRVYSPDGKAVTLCGNGGGVGAKTGLYAIPVEIEWHDGKTYPIYEVSNGLIKIKEKQYPVKLLDGYYIIRKLTVAECSRLQTIPEWYQFIVSNSQAYKLLGNGWTVDVISHILSFANDIRTAPLDVLSMYDGMGCGRIALNNLGATVNKYFATEIDKYAIQNTVHNFPDTIQLGDAFQIRDINWCVEKHVA